MKKTILTIMATVGIMTIGFTGTIVGINSDYEDKLMTAMNSYEEQIEEMADEYEELETMYEDSVNQMEQLEDQVYNVMTDKDYDVTIDHNGVIHTWSSGDGGTHTLEFVDYE